MRIATWNVNSIRARLPRLLAWLAEAHPDVLCLQETKVRDDVFPRAEIEEAGYHAAYFGERTYNGVAILSRETADEIICGLPDDAVDCERRVIACRFGGQWAISIYAPNGTAVGSPRFEYKLQWFRRLRGFLEARWQPGDNIALCGDFNVAPEDRDVHDPDAWRGQIMFHPDEQAALRNVMEWGLRDAFRLHVQEGGYFTWWDYRAGAFHRGWGLRIDLMLVTEPLVPRCQRVFIDRNARKGPKPSDHAPVVIELA